MRKADDGANEHEEDRELGVHLITPNIISYIALKCLLLHLPWLSLTRINASDDNRHRCISYSQAHTSHAPLAQACTFSIGAMSLLGHSRHIQRTPKTNQRPLYTQLRPKILHRGEMTRSARNGHACHQTIKRCTTAKIWPSGRSKHIPNRHHELTASVRTLFQKALFRRPQENERATKIECSHSSNPVFLAHELANQN